MRLNMAAAIIAPGDARRYAKHLSARGIPPLLQATATAKALRFHGRRIADHILAGRLAQTIPCRLSSSSLRLSTHPRSCSARPRGTL
uniref:Uncharacterized protein n=1 Tax=Ralstonia syzygii R24 TaxID=907261 RepID=G3AC10_9RALS|nr:hypothetical protein RALSY_mp30400 [Ralstonia syzygii R24]